MGSGWDMSIQQLGCKKGRGRARLLAVGQDSRFPISRKGTGAMVPRCHVGKEFGSQGKERPENSIPGTGARRQNQHASGLEQEGGEERERRREGAAQGGTEQWGGSSDPSGSVLQDWAREM